MIGRILRRLRKPRWEYGSWNSLEARRHRVSGVVEVWCERTNPEHSLWMEIHPSHWSEWKEKEDL